MLPSFFFVVKARNGKRGEREEEAGKITSVNEGRVIVKTSRDRNIRWGHCNQQMYDVDGKGYALEQAEWMRTDLQSMRRSLCPASVCHHL